MKKLLIFGVVALLTACGSTSQSTTATTSSLNKNGKSVKNDKTTEYCTAVGGKVKVVEGASDAFCVLPGGDVVKLQTFYDNNH